MASYWGVSPHLLEFTTQTDETIHNGDTLLKTKGLVKTGDLVITVSGVTLMKGATNMLKISRFDFAPGRPA
jgi:pyruvate kinase